MIAVLLTILSWNGFAQENKIPEIVPGSCTIFSAAIGDNVLFGNNEDATDSNTCYWTEPGDDENYGCLYLGFEQHLGPEYGSLQGVYNSLQGGINEKGLCFDANSLPGLKLNPHAELPSPPTLAPPNEKYATWVAVTILRKAATVEEAIEIASKYQRHNWDMMKTDTLKYQLHFADAKGDVVIISADTLGELSFTRKKHEEKYLVSTNFNIADPKNAWSYSYPCWRYDKAVAMLDKLRDENDLTVDYFKAILDSVHFEYSMSHTLYSNIFDLPNGIIYLYYWHQYDEVAKLNIIEELGKGENKVFLKDLFSHETIEKAEVASKNYKY